MKKANVVIGRAAQIRGPIVQNGTRTGKIVLEKKLIMKAAMKLKFTV